MAWYWLLFAIPALGALLENRYGRLHPLALSCFGLILILAIGFRYEVGGDWFSYLSMLLRAGSERAPLFWISSDPGFAMLNVLVARANLDIWAVNAVCAALFTGGLIRFCRAQPRPWLALLVSVPYLVIVVAMGYTRQSVAIGLIMAGLPDLQRDRKIRFLAWVLVAATFHKSAVLLIPVAMLISSRNWIISFLWIAFIGIAAYLLLLADSVESLRYGYLESQYSSGGASVRIAMNAVPASLFIWKARDFGLKPVQRRLWTYLSIASLGAVAALLLSPSSTAVDRLALYLIPMQLFTFSHLPEALGPSPLRRVAPLGVVIYSGLILFVWLNFGSHAFAWLPYRSFLLP